MTARPELLEIHRIRRGFLVLQAVRWLPTGILLPVLVLFLTGKGLTLAQVGLVLAAQGAATFLLELPTGGLADRWGRRPVLVLAGVFQLASLVLLVVAQALPLLLLAGALQGVYRALESGPVESWFVDRSQAADPDVDFETTFVHGGVVVGLAMAAGALAGGGLVAWDPLASIEALALPLVVSLLLRLVELAVVLAVVDEPRRLPRTAAAAPGVAGLADVLAQGVRATSRSATLRLLVTAALLWGVASTAFEVLPPVRLEELLASPDRAASVLGPLNAGAWAAVAAGAALAARLRRRVGPVIAAGGFLVLQAGAVAVMGLAGGLVGLAAGYLLTYAAHGASNPLLTGLAHRAITGDAPRTTVVSTISMAAMLGGAAGGILLGGFADVAGARAAMLAGAGLVLATAAVVLRLRTTPAAAEPIASDPAAAATASAGGLSAGR